MTKTTTYEQISDYIDGNMTDNQLKEFEIMMSGNKKLQEERQKVIAFSKQTNTPIIDTTRYDKLMELLK